MYTALVSVHGTYTAVYTVRHGPYAARSRPCTPPLQGRVRAIYTAVYTAVVYMAGRTTGPCTRSQTARYGRVRPVTTVYTARYGIRSVYATVHTARVDEHVQGCVWDVYTTVYMARYSRVHGPRP